MIRSLVLALALLAPTALLAQEGDPITEFSAQDQVMNAAMDEAKITLPLFLANVTNGEGFSEGNAAVKVAFPTGGDGAEIIWVSPFLWEGGETMAGLLANQPNFLGGLNAGDRVDFTTDMVRDWSWVTEDGMLWGNYTTRVMVPQLDEETAAGLKAVLSTSPVPADWQ